MVYYKVLSGVGTREATYVCVRELNQLDLGSREQQFITPLVLARGRGMDHKAECDPENPLGMTESVESTHCCGWEDLARKGQGARPPAASGTSVNCFHLCPE